MKIRKFRIRPRLATVGRLLKAQLGVRQLPPELEQSLPQESETFLSHITPAAFYHTWARDEVPAVYRPVLEQAGHSKAIAVTAVVATIGAGPEEFLSQLLLEGEAQRAQAVSAFGEDAADLSFQFILRLLADDAKNDDCETSDPMPVTDSILLGETLSLLEASAEGVDLDSAGHLSPRFTRVGLSAWTPVSKKKRSATPIKKR